jgi:hypothetical protein
LVSEATLRPAENLPDAAVPLSQLADDVPGTLAVAAHGPEPVKLGHAVAQNIPVL